MSENCNHDCEHCQEKDGCSTQKASLKVELNDLSKVKKVIGIVSGKGGVGKSLVTSLLAVSMNKLGNNVGIIDADITGASIMKIFGLHGEAQGLAEDKILPIITKNKIAVMSINLFLKNDTDPVIWRGPILAGAVKQFWTDVVWKDIDYMFVDMPPGTGDVPLTVFQSLPLDGIVIVTSPQELVSQIVAKAYNMAKMMNIPIIGLVENMSYFECPGCHEKFEIFGKSKIDDVAKEFNIQTIDRIPITPKYADLCDKGAIEEYQDNVLKNIVSKIKELNN